MRRSLKRLSSILSSRNRSRRPRHQRSRGLRFEPLEQRDLLTANFLASVRTETLPGTSTAPNGAAYSLDAQGNLYNSTTDTLIDTGVKEFAIRSDSDVYEFCRFFVRWTHESRSLEYETHVLDSYSPQRNPLPIRLSNPKKVESAAELSEIAQHRE